MHRLLEGNEEESREIYLDKVVIHNATLLVIIFKLNVRKML